jgi:hypothetical protein
VRHGERGQVLPLWIGATITTLMFAFLAANYGNTLRYQIRAQNAADSYAQVLMSVQAERYNMMTEALYGTAVEEYRLRHLLDGILLAANDSGGCQDMYGGYIQNSVTGALAFPPGTCSEVYADLSNEYFASLNRYTVDIKLLNDYSNGTNWNNWLLDTASLTTHLNNNCNQPGAIAPNPAGDDCAFGTPGTYHILAQTQRTGLLAVQEDAQDILVPSLGHDSTLPNDTENQTLFDPGQVDVTTCLLIPPVVPNFGPLHLPSSYAIGRAAATTVMFEEDWLQPGAIYDPANRPADTAFQPWENYTDFTTSDTTETYNWYGVDFGGNAAVAYVNYNDFDQPTYDNEFSVKLGWWSALAIKPFATAPTPAQACK